MKLIVLRAGDAAAPVAARRGQFLSWIQREAGDAWTGEWHEHDVRTDAPLPGARDADAFIMTGSSSSVTERAPWMLRSEELIRAIAAAETPFFGICFGHQMVGQALGGRDIGSVHANDIYFGVYTFDFVYNLGVTPVPNDDDLEVVGPNHQNFGSITAPNGLGTTTLTDESMGGHSFQLGDEDGPGPTGGPGHRGWNGISGWGWMSYVYPTGIVHEPATDWLFTATYVIPTPGASAILGLGGLALLRRRR